MKAIELTNLMPECCSEVLDAIYFTTVLGSESQQSMSEAAPANPPVDDSPISFSLCFVGDISGRFGVSLDRPTARSPAANFLGEDETDVSPRSSKRSSASSRTCSAAR